MRSNTVNALALGVDGTIWIGTDSGATTFAHSYWGDVHENLRDSSDSPDGDTTAYKVTAMASSYDGSIWFGTAGGGVRRFKVGASTRGWQAYRETTIVSNRISAMAIDPHSFGEVWVGTPILGVSRFMPDALNPDGGTWLSYTGIEVPQLGSNSIRSAAHNPQDGSFWFGSMLSVCFFTAGSVWKEVYIPSAYRSTVFSIAFDYSNTAWLGQQDGVTTFQEPNHFQHFSFNSTGGKFPRAKVIAIVSNNYSLRWFGTESGLAQLKDTSWTVFSSATVSEFTSDIVTALCYDRRGNLWIGTTDGVLVYNESGISF